MLRRAASRFGTLTRRWIDIDTRIPKWSPEMVSDKRSFASKIDEEIKASEDMFSPTKFKVVNSKTLFFCEERCSATQTRFWHPGTLRFRLLVRCSQRKETRKNRKRIGRCERLRISKSREMAFVD